MAEIKYSEKYIENDVFNNLEKYIGPYEKKRKSVPPITPFTDNLDGGFRFGYSEKENRHIYSKFKKADILATTKEGVLKIIEIKKHSYGWRDTSVGIVQLLEYYRLAIINSNKKSEQIEMYLIVDKEITEIRDLISFYGFPIKYIVYKRDT